MTLSEIVLSTSRDKATNNQTNRIIHIGGGTLKDFYSVNELAEQLGVTTRSIRNYLHEGKLKGTKVGGQWKFSERNLLNFFTEIKQMKQQKTCNDSC